MYSEYENGEEYSNHVLNRKKYIDKICTISRLHGDEDTTTWKQRKFLVTSNLLYNFRFMTNLTNSYVFPSYISFHDKLDTALTHSLKDEEMMLRN